MAKSRAEYFRKRRETRKMFCAMLDREQLDRFDEWLHKHHMSRVTWLNNFINSTLGSIDTTK